MSRPRTYQTEAIIIRKTKLGEADRILTLYTPDLGKVQAVARGIRRPRSKLAGHLELLTHSHVTLARGRNLDTITGSQTINSLLLLKTDLRLAAYGLYASELLHQFTEDGVENRPLFQLLLETLQWLCQPGDSDLLLRSFELRLLSLAGYRPQLDCCVACRAALPVGTSYFSASAGGMLCADCRRGQPVTHPLPADALAALRALQRQDTPTGPPNPAPGVNREIKTVLRGYIRYLLERDVKSAAWLDAMATPV